MYYGPGTNDLTFTPLTRAEETALFERYYAGDLAARDELVQKHLRLVAKLSISYAKHALPEDEAISAGNYGLMQALNSKRFKPGIGTLFSTYLRSWVQGEIRRALREKGQNRLFQPEALNFFGEGAALTGRIDHLNRNERLFCANGPDDRNPGCGRIPDEVSPSVADLYEEQQINEERRKALAEAMTLLTPIEKASLFGIVCADKTYSDLGRENKVSRQACKKAHARALRKLREALSGQYENLM